MARPWLVIPLVGCSGASDELLPSPAEIVDGASVVGFEALGGAGDAPYRTQVRAINAWGASVKADDAVATVDGVERTVLFDALGYGGFAIDAPGDHAVSIDGGTPATVSVFERTWAGLGGSPAYVPPIAGATQVFGVTGGLVATSGPDLWFVGDETPAHRVLHADADLLGVLATNVDVDGRTDVVAWTTTQVFVLRGHTGGGLGWGTSFRAQGLTAAAVAVGDLSADNLPDIAITWVGADGKGILDVWEAVGVFRFEGAEPRNIPGKPVSATVSDANADGVSQVTVLHDDGSWSRFLRGAERQYIPVGPTLPPALNSPPQSTLLTCGDVNGDDADEIVIASPFAVDSPRDFWFVDIDTEPLDCDAGLPGAQCLTEYVLVDGLVGGDVGCGDVNADTVDEIWAWDRGAGLRIYQHEPFSDQFASGIIDFPLGTGSFAVSDQNSDGIADPIVANDLAWSQWVGATFAEAEGLWSPRRELTVEVRDDVISPFVRIETDGDDTTLEWATTTTASAGTSLRILQYVPSSGGATSLGDVRIDDVGDVPVDLAVCGPNAYVALGGHVTRVVITDPTAPFVAQTEGEDLQRVACGTGPGGAVVVTVDGSGVAETWTTGLGRIAALDGIYGDAGFADLGAGPEIIGCATAGCGVAAWNYGSGTAVVAGDAAGLTFSETGLADRTEPGAGIPLVADVDGDGRLDLAAWDRGARRLTVYRSTGDGVAVPALVNLAGDYRHVDFADGDGDGAPDLFGADETDRLVHTVLVLPPPPPETTGT
jgi:hypothetical protein